MVVLALLVLVIACACIYSLKKAADQARKDRVVTIIGNIEYFNNSSPQNKTNQITQLNSINNRVSTDGNPIKLNRSQIEASAAPSNKPKL